MRKGGSKQKGASFERDVCTRLSLWLSKGAHEDLLWRSAMSGGRSTVAAAKGNRLQNQAGDISAVHPMGHLLTDKFILECKAYLDLGLGGFIKGKGNLITFWEKLVIDSTTYSKLPLLIAKQNNHPIFICLNRQGCSVLQISERKVEVTVNRFHMKIILFDNLLKLDPNVLN